MDEEQQGTGERVAAEAGADRESAGVDPLLRAVGKQVKRLRENAGLTQPELGKRIGYGVDQVSAVERGRRPAKAQFIDGCERELNAGGVLKAVQGDVDRARLPARFRDFAKWEKDAASLYSYAPLVIPGLLQADAYARTLIESHFPPLDQETAEERIAARIDRRAIFEQDRGVITGFVIEETVLRRPFGGPAVMREQLTWLLAMGERPNIAIQVMPTAQWRHPGFLGGFTLLETKDGRNLAYTESQGISAVITDHRKVRVYAQRHGMIRMQALDTAESARIIEELVEAL